MISRYSNNWSRESNFTRFDLWVECDFMVVTSHVYRSLCSRTITTSNPDCWSCFIIKSWINDSNLLKRTRNRNITSRTCSNSIWNVENRGIDYIIVWSRRYNFNFIQFSVNDSITWLIVSNFNTIYKNTCKSWFCRMKTAIFVRKGNFS